MSDSSNPLQLGARPDGETFSIEPLSSLSDEILLMILKSIITPLETLCGSSSYPSSSQNILNFALCSRRLFEIAEPFLFNQLEQKSYEKGERALQLILCRILAKPELKKHVYKIQTRAKHTDEVGGTPMDLSMIRADDWRRIREAVHSCCSDAEEATNWIEDMENGHWDGFLALIMCIAPNFQELHIGAWGQIDGDYPLLTNVLERAAELQKSSIVSVGSLSNLKTVSLSYWDTEGGMWMGTFNEFLALDSVTSIEGCMVEVEDSWNDFNPAGWARLRSYDYSKGFKSLRDLDLHSSNIGPNYLITILRWFPYLERISYFHTGLHKFAPPAIMAGLKHLEGSLQELVLDYNCGAESDFGGEVYNFPIGSLVTFQKLRYLNLSQSILIGDDTVDSEYDSSGTLRSTQNLATSLPPNLERLCIRHYDHRIAQPVFELITKKDQYTPALKSLDLSWTQVVYPDEDPELVLEQPGFTREEVLKLLAECKAAGVEMVLRGIQPPYKDIKLLIEGKKFQLGFTYPYVRYKEWCEHLGCSLETGKPANFDDYTFRRALPWRGDWSKVTPKFDN
jgi:hypothetical protein